MSEVDNRLQAGSANSALSTWFLLSIPVNGTPNRLLHCLKSFYFLSHPLNILTDGILSLVGRMRVGFTEM